MCRPPNKEEEPLAIQAIEAELCYDDIYDLGKTRELPTKPPRSRRQRACFWLCCGAPADCHRRRSRCCAARWCLRLAVWAVFLLGVIAFYVWRAPALRYSSARVEAT